MKPTTVYAGEGGYKGDFAQEECRGDEETREDPTHGEVSDGLRLDQVQWRLSLRGRLALR